MRGTLRAALLVALGLAASPALPGAAAWGGEPAQDLKSPDVSVRLQAVKNLATSPAANAEQLLLQALGDSDWEVVERAATALGERGADAAVKPLVKLALDGKARRVRVLAARALARLPSWEAEADQLGKVRPDDLPRALDAVAAIADLRESEVLVRIVERGLAAKKETAWRQAAARAVGAFPPDARLLRLAQLSADSDVAVAAAVVDAARAKPLEGNLGVFVEILVRPRVPETVARRARAGIVEEAGRRPKGADAARVAKQVGDALAPCADAAATNAGPAWQLARCVGELAELPDEHVPRAALNEALAPAVRSPQTKVRACAAWGLGRIGGDLALQSAKELATTDGDPRVRLVALQSVARMKTAEDDAAFKLFCDRVTVDVDPLVREEAAVHLGRRGVAGTLPTLRTVVERSANEKDPKDWPVAVAALVSLGKTRDPDVVPFLVEMTTKAKDWKLRAAALVGLGHVQDKRAVPVLIDALGGKEPIYRNVAYEFLRRAHPDGPAAKQAEWKAWWEKAGADFRWVDREEEVRKAQKYGYAPDLTGVYEGLDVVVFQSRGDKIEELLKQLKIEHRLTRSGQVMDAGMSPHAIFVSNCTGEITAKDVEPIAWFIRAGGYFFGSCWSLNKTIELCAPGCLRKFDIKGQVIDDVISEPCRPGSPFVEGVFPPLVRPIYILEGAHLIDVQDPERAEVLMDSPWTEEKYGNGNLVAWFPLGHGIVLDSANHFELQGFAHAKTESPDEMMAHALDHLGLTYAEVRKIPSAAWRNKQDAGKEAKDLSCFRFLTNFVRQKRKSQE